MSKTKITYQGKTYECTWTKAEEPQLEKLKTEEKAAPKINYDVPGPVADAWLDEWHKQFTSVP